MSHKKTGFIEVAMRNHNIVVIISVILMVIGVIALQKMPRNEFPQFTIRQGVIVGVYPGATSAEVEAQLTKTVENYIFGYQEVKKAKTYSHSKEGIMYIFVELNDDVKNAGQFWSKLKHGLSELKMTLPTGVLALIANADFGDTSALLITLSSDTRSYKELEEQLKRLETECRKIPATSKIKHFGLQKEKIFVNVKPEMLNEYNIKTLSLLGSYQLNGMVGYAGELRDGSYNLAVHLPPNFESEKDLADQIVYSDPYGNIVRLKNIASIDRRYDDPDSYISQNGKKTVLLSLEMQQNKNIVAYGQEVDKAIATFQKSCPEDMKVAKISELPKYVDDSVSNFMEEFLIAIVAVILVTMLLLPLRVASVAGITVPVSVLITLCILYFIGIELHTVSLASLILVLGMIVDNSIVVIDNHVEKIDHGTSPWHAAISSAKELFLPIVTATLAIIVTYIPIGLMVPGTAGEFLETIPVVVSTALIVSIIVATLLVPYLNFVFIKKGLKSENGPKKGRSFLERLQGWYDVSLEKVFIHPKYVITASAVMVVLAIILIRNTDQQLFPELERNQFAVEVYLPTGSSLENTALIVDSMEHVLLNDERVTNVTSFVGTSSPRFQVAYAPNMPSPNYGQLLVNTTSDKATRAIVEDYSAKFANHYENAHVKFKILALQLNKAPIEIRITSDSVKDIRKVESQVNEILKKTAHIAWSRTDWNEMQQSIRVNLSRDKANRMGYSKGFVSASLMVGLEGLPLTTIWENDYPVEVRLTQEDGAKKSMKTLENQYITSLPGLSASPLRSFASLSPEWSEGTIVHRNGTPTLTIFIDNDLTGVAAKMFDEIKPQVDNLKLPEGTTINYGGDYEGQEEVFTPMTIALALSIVIIFFILLFQFKKVKLSLLIMSTMLLTLPGAAIGLKLMGYPFSITAFVGISSLCGMVVRNGIILIDYARVLRGRNKIPVREAALMAGKRRMRPIFLTSAAASVGVIPMIMSRSPLWGPLGTVICFGLLVSMVLTLYVLPIVYSWMYTDRPAKPGFWSVPPQHHLKHKHKPVMPLSMPLLVIALLLFSVGANGQSLSLDSCKRLALQNNAKVKNKTLDVRASEEVKKAAFTKYFPQIEATGLTYRFSEPLFEMNIPGGNLPVYDGNPANLPTATQFAWFPGSAISMFENGTIGLASATQPLFAGGRIITGNKLASLGVEVSQIQLAAARDEISIQTEEQYWQIAALGEKIKTLEGYIQLLDTLHKEVNDAFRAGLINRNELLKVELRQNELEMNRIRLVNGIVLARMALCQHIGIPFNQEITFADSLIPTVNPQLIFTDHQQALTTRDEYRLLQKSREAEKYQTKMQRGEYMPKLGVGVGGMYLDIMKDESSTAGMVFGSVNIPVSGWWEASHKLKERRITEEQNNNMVNDHTEKLLLQMQQARNALDEAYQQVRLAEISIRQAEENLKVSSDNYKAGMVNVSEVLEAQALVQSSRDNLANIRCSYQVARAKYLLVTGKYEQ
ncbi:MAG TPA: efflux RND transporter permease subunit [Prolixibacteraceae bacterium]|nr:efflux RND transporter permease subunit [Prolixibacteraceae bacterium]